MRKMAWGVTAAGLAAVPAMWMLAGCGESGAPRNQPPSLGEVGAVYYTPQGPSGSALEPAVAPQSRYQWQGKASAPAAVGGAAGKTDPKAATKKATVESPVAEGGPKTLSPRMQRLMTPAVVANLEKVGKPTKAHYILCNAVSEAAMGAGSQSPHFRPMSEVMAAAYPYALAKIAPNLKELTQDQVKDLKMGFDSRIKAMINDNQGEADELVAFVFGTDGLVDQNIFFNGLARSETVSIPELTLDSARAAGASLVTAIRPGAAAALLDQLLPKGDAPAAEPEKKDAKDEKKDGGGAAIGPVPDKPVLTANVKQLLALAPNVSAELDKIGKPKASHNKLANAIGLLIQQAPGAKPQFKLMGELIQGTFAHVLARAAPTLPDIDDDDVNHYAGRFKPILDDLVKSGLEMEALKTFVNGADGLTNDNKFYQGLDPKIAGNKKFQDSGLTLEGLREASSMYIKVFAPYAKLAGLEGLGG